MGTVYCDNCGASLLEESAKFCRACGKPTPLSEAATKRFDEQPVVQVPTSPVGQSLTTPAYMAPFEPPPPLQTNDLRNKRQKRNLIILASMLAFMVLALGGLLLFLNFGPGSEGIPAPPKAPSGATITPIPSVPGVGPVPTIPPAPRGLDGPSTIDASLIYPEAETTLIRNEGGKSVLKLHSNDTVRKVADWYIARLKTAKKVDIVGRTTILQAGDISVVIMGGEGGAEILITRGGEEK